MAETCQFNSSSREAQLSWSVLTHMGFPGHQSLKPSIEVFLTETILRSQDLNEECRSRRKNYIVK